MALFGPSDTGQLSVNNLVATIPVFGSLPSVYTV